MNISMDLRAQIGSQTDIFYFNDLRDYKTKELADGFKLSYFKNADLQTIIFPSNSRQLKDNYHSAKICSDAWTQCQFQKNKDSDSSKISQHLLIAHYNSTVGCIKQMQNTIKSLFYQINNLRLNSTDSYHSRIFFTSTVERGINEFSELSEIGQNIGKSYINLNQKIVCVKKYISAFNLKNCLKMQAPSPFKSQQIYISKIFRV